jgi:hypothetical protein
MLDELQSWWESATPATQKALQDGSVVLLALLSGYLLGVWVARTLRRWNFDAALRLPNAAPPGSEAEHGLTPTLVAGLLVRLTVWAAAACWLAHQYGRADLASSLVRIIQRTWAVAAVVVGALALGSLLARRLIDCVGGLTVAGSGPSHHGTASSHRGVAGALGAGAYILAVLLVLLIAADSFDWPLTRSAALALWQFAQHLLVAGAALLIGCLGARWARDQVTPEGSASPEKRAGQYTALGIVAATTVLAVAVLLSSAGVLIGLVALTLLGWLFWLLRSYLPDIAAGLQLRAHNVREVWFDGAAWQVAEAGFLATQVSRAGQFCRLQNRVVLEARLHEAPKVTPVEVERHPVGAH